MYLPYYVSNVKCTELIVKNNNLIIHNTKMYDQ